MTSRGLGVKLGAALRETPADVVGSGVLDREAAWIETILREGLTLAKLPWSL